MGGLRLYLDECIDHRLLPTLADRGHELLSAQDAGARQWSDEAQLLRASELERLLMSHNQVHFRRLHRRFGAEGRPHSGIVLLPQTMPLARLCRRAALLLDWVLTHPEHRSHLYAWGALQQLLLRGYRLSGWDEATVRDTLGWEPPA